jgi:stearoyl-CoA desaturase (delta-9 desaturase)
LSTTSADNAASPAKTGTGDNFSPNSIPFVLVHVAAVFAFFVDFQWWYVALAVASYYVRMFGITGGFHRYFSHRGYKTGRVFQFFLAFLGGTAAQKGCLWWAAHHRHHHKHSDDEDDVHSPTLRGFYWSHVGWVVADTYRGTREELVRDFSKYPELVFLNTYYWIPPFLYALGMWGLGEWLTGSGWGTLVWGFVISTVFLWHGTFFINSLAHVFGRRRYPTTDTSKNSFLLSLLTLGEGWHNNHHYYPNTANNGFYWWELDITYYVLRVFSWVGLVWDLRVPPQRVLEQGRQPLVEGTPLTAAAARAARAARLAAARFGESAGEAAHGIAAALNPPVADGTGTAGN